MSSKDAGSRGAADAQGEGRMWAWLRSTTPLSQVKGLVPMPKPGSLQKVVVFFLASKNRGLLKFAKDCLLVFFP